MDVDDYLKQVKEESDALPDVVVADVPESKQDESSDDATDTEDPKRNKLFTRLILIDEELKDLDTGFRLTSDELKYFRLIKKNIMSKYGTQDIRVYSSMWKYAMEVSGLTHANPDDLDKIWRPVIKEDPPPIHTLAEYGINHACIQDCLGMLVHKICQFPGVPISKTYAKWLYTLLLMLDELMASVEDVCYELQRARRALLRRCMIIESSKNYDIEEISQNRVLACLISSHFHQY